MRRRRAKKKTQSLSLFPFLAVLICTMGGLIVLLVVVVQQARAHAETVASSRAAELEKEAERLRDQRQEKRLDLEDSDWRLEVLMQQRKEMLQSLAEQGRRLSHLEDHFLRLQEKLKKALANAEELKNSDSANRNVAQLREQIEQTARQIEQAKREVAEAERKAADKPRTFSIVPYQGPNGTQRRPIYIECRGDRVILQPEGIALRSEDFEGPLGAGNPLDAALRAVREHYLSQPNASRQGDPYPLLVVRPHGAASYTAARAAMKSWDDEFGYELVDEEIELAFPPPDPRLKDRLEAIVDQARRRQAIVRAAQSSRGGRSDIRGFRAAPGGRGLVPVGEGEGDSPYSGGFADWGGDRETVESPGGASGGPANRFTNNAEGDDSQANQSAAVSGGQPPGQGAAQPQSLAKSRGKNWGLPDADRSAVGFTRPIYAQCFADRIMLNPARSGGAAPQVVIFNGPTRGSVDTLVSALWKRIESWGIAGRQAYWKPVLSVTVAPNGESRFRELQLLFKDSGIELERKTP